MLGYKEMVRCCPCRLQSTSSARSTASRENDVTFKIPAGVPSNGPTTPQVRFSPQEQRMIEPVV